MLREVPVLLEAHCEGVDSVRPLVEHCTHLGSYYENGNLGFNIGVFHEC
jgi:hypothetical protein